MSVGGFGLWNEPVNIAATSLAYCELPGDTGVRVKIERV